METRRLIGIFALTAACALTPAVFADDEPGEETPSFVVSSEFMDTLEAWSSPSATAETLALDSRPELIEEYAALAEEHHGGRPLAEVFAEQLPQTWAEIAAALGTGEDGEAPAAADLLAYAMAGGSEEFQVWQAALADQGADFRGFVAESHPEVMEELATTGLSPADQGVGLRDFAEAKGTAGGLDALAFEPQTQQHLLKCSCFTTVSFDDFPRSNWHMQAENHWSNRSGLFKRKLDQFDYTLWSRGVARDLEFNRRSEHQVTEQQRDARGQNYSRMRVNLTCLRMPVLVGSNPKACPAADACTGKLYASVGYGSRVYENHSVGGVWTRDAKTLSADLARLTYQASGSPIQLFAKGVAVAGSFQLDWSHVRDLATQFYGPGMPLLTAPFGSTIPGTSNPSISGFAGLTFLTGVAGSHSLIMKAGWGNLYQPYTMQAGQTHTFLLGADSRAYGRGLGGQSDTRNHLDSAYYLMAMTRNDSCPPGGYGPGDRAFWNYAGAPDAPYDLNALRDLVRDNARYAGSGVSNVNTVPGQYP